LLGLAAVLLVEPVVAAMFAAHVMAMDPVMMMRGPVARNPDHLIVASPIAGSVRIIRTVAYFDVELRLRDSGKNETQSQHGYKGQLVLFHNL